ncbi:MAG TPA: phosphoribosylanthranilate isomerase [Polyangiaceae bacterium]|nr:phosphoribosylanthranilate isomerase [Polyangiaceae bacterium]
MYVKVCGITELDDALAAADAGADALGFNCIPSSKRFAERALIRNIVAGVRRAGLGVCCVAVVADMTVPEALALLEELELDRLQLHGDEPPEDLVAFGARAYKALRVADATDVASARTFPGHPLLVDAKVTGQLGGTGQCVDWPLVEPLARARPLLLAGGLTPLNVGAAVSAVQPWGVDVASGVEIEAQPRRKDAGKLRRFVEAARAASRAEHGTPF